MNSHTTTHPDGNDPLNDLISAIRNLTNTQAATVRQALGATTPSASTRLRRRTSGNHVFPVIARSSRTYKEPDGRLYGETPTEHQRQADAKYWRVGKTVRDQCHPMTVSVDGTVTRIWEVLAWDIDPETGKYAATLGRLLTDADLDAEYPDYPYRHGDECPTRQGSAYRPESY